jgi:hypothetical protein
MTNRGIVTMLNSYIVKLERRGWTSESYHALFMSAITPPRLRPDLWVTQFFMRKGLRAKGLEGKVLRNSPPASAYARIFSEKLFFGSCRRAAAVGIFRRYASLLYRLLSAFIAFYRLLSLRTKKVFFADEWTRKDCKGRARMEDGRMENIERSTCFVETFMNTVKKLDDARPHPGPLPQGEGEPSSVYGSLRSSFQSSAKGQNGLYRAHPISNSEHPIFGEKRVWHPTFARPCPALSGVVRLFRGGKQILHGQPMSNQFWQSGGMNELKNNCCWGKRRWPKAVRIGRIRPMKCGEVEGGGSTEAGTVTPQLTINSALLMMN